MKAKLLMMLCFLTLTGCCQFGDGSVSGSYSEGLCGSGCGSSCPTCACADPTCTRCNPCLSRERCCRAFGNIAADPEPSTPPECQW